MITREDLANKKIDKLENIEQAKEMINLLTYDECLAVLNGTKNIPHEIYSALMAQAKKENNGITSLALAIAGLQNISNQPKRSEMTVHRERPPDADDGRSRKSKKAGKTG